MQTGRRSRRKEIGNDPLEVDIDQRGDLLHFPMPPHKYGLNACRRLWSSWKGTMTEAPEKWKESQLIGVQSLLLVANHQSTATTRGETYHLLWSKKSRTDIPMSVDWKRYLEGGTSLWGRNFFTRVFSKDSWEVISSENVDSNWILISWDELRVKALHQLEQRLTTFLRAL